MGLYDAVDRGGAGRKKERTLRRPLLIAAAILAAVIALIAWSCRYFFQYRSWVSDLTEATRYARRTGAFTVTVAGAAAEAEAAAVRAAAPVRPSWSWTAATCTTALSIWKKS